VTADELKQFIAEQVQQEVARRLAKLEKPILGLVQHLSKMEDRLDKLEDGRAQALQEFQELLKEGGSGTERMEPRAQDMETMMSEIERLLRRRVR
jgi:phage shock protein A